MSGQNAGAVAELSWQPDAITTDRSVLPPGLIPLYVRIHGVVDLRALGIQLKWYPLLEDSTCYQLVDGPTPDSCGMFSSLAPNATSADTGYTSSIRFLSGTSGDLCLVAWFAHENCPSILPGRFYVPELMLEGEDGERDFVPVLTEATILGGEGIPQPLAAQAAGGNWLTPGFVNQLHVQGVGFNDASTFTLLGPEGSIAGDFVLDSDRSLAATVDIPESFVGNAQLVIGTSYGVNDTLPFTISTYDTSAATGSGTNHSGYDMDKPAPGGAWRKGPNSSEWTFVSGIPDSLMPLGPSYVQELVLDGARSKASGPSAGTDPLAGSVAPDSLPFTSQSTEDYTLSSLFNATFEEQAWDTDWQTATTGSGTLAGWGARTNACAKVLSGSYSLSAAGHPSNAHCFGYSTESNSSLVQRYPTDIGTYKSAQLAFWRWVDIRDSSGTPIDKLSWYYSTNGSASWIPKAAGSTAITGEDRVWRKENLILDTQDGQVYSVRFRVDFEPRPTSGFTTLPNDSGVFVDDVSIVGTPKPNLTFTAPTINGVTWSAPIVASNVSGDRSNPTLVSGRMAYFSYAVRNNSISASGPFKVVLNIDGLGDVISGTLDDGLTAGQVVTKIDQAFFIPAGYCGQKQARLSIDYDDEVLEANESTGDNNYFHTLVSTSGSVPDLRVVSAWAEPAAPCAGQSVTLKAVVQNAGASAAGNSYVGFELFPIGSWFCSTYSRMGMVSSLSAGAYDTVSVQVSSQTVTTRQYYFKADCSGAIGEGCASQEANNEYGPITVSWGPLGADLEVTSLYVVSDPLLASQCSAKRVSVDAYATVGHSEQIAIEVSNVGQAATPTTWSVDWYMDRGSSPGPGEAGTVRKSIKGALAPGQDTVIYLSKTSAVSGSWRMYARANVSGAVPECLRFANNVIGPTTLVWNTDSLLVEGTFSYRDTNYVRPGTQDTLRAIHPLRGARVAIMDSNTGTAHRVLGTTCTDDYGHFALALPSRYDPEAGPTGDTQHVVDVFARVLLNADDVCAGIPAVTVKHRSDSTTWSFDGPVHLNVSGATLNLGDMRPGNDYGTRSAMHLYETVLRAAQVIRANGYEPVFTPVYNAWQSVVRWDAGGAGYQAYTSTLSLVDTIWVVGQRNLGNNELNPDEWDDYILLHEYGHLLATKGSFRYVLPSAGCGAHAAGRRVDCPAGTPSPGLAWEEGWSQFIAAWLDSAGPNPVIMNRGFDGNDLLYSNIYNLETGAGEVGRVGAGFAVAYSANDSGASFQESNSGVLWDLVDAVDDDQNNDGHGDHITQSIGNVLTTLLQDGYQLNLDSLVNFYQAYQHRFCADSLGLARSFFELMREHGFWTTDSSVAYVTVAPQLRGGVSMTLSPSPTRSRTLVSVAAPRSAGSPPPAVEVFDVSGRVLRRIEARWAGANLWLAEWDGLTQSGESARSGVYFVRCRTESATMARTLVLRR